MFPIKYIDNNLVWNKDNEVFAYYELIPYNYSFLSAEQKFIVHDSFRQLIAQSREGKIHALQIATESSIKSIQEQSKKLITGRLKEVAYQKIDEQTEALVSMIGDNQVDYRFFLGFKLMVTEQEMNIKNIRKSAFMTFKEFIHEVNHTLMNDFVSMPNDEINRYLKMEKLLENKISRRFKVRRLETNDFGYLIEHLYGRDGIAYEDYEYSLPKKKLKKETLIKHYDLIRPTRCLVEESQRHLRLEHEDSESYVSYFTVNAIVGELDFPSSEIFYFQQQQFTFPVDTSMNVEIVENRKALSTVRNKKKELKDLDNHAYQSGSETSSNVVDALDSVDELETDLDQSKESMYKLSYVIRVSAPDLDELKRRCDEVKDFYDDLNVKLVRPAGDMLGLHSEFLPASKRYINDYVQYVKSDFLAGLGFGATQQLGENTGIYIGYSVDTGRNVYLQPSLASQGVKGTVTNALASAFVGSLGGGKSFCNNLLVYYAVLFGGQALRVFNTIMTRAGITLIVTVAFSISSMFYNISTDYPFFMVAFLQIVCFAGIYMKLGDLMSMFSLNAGDSQSMGRRIFRRPYLFMRHRARRMEHRLTRAVGKGSMVGAGAGAMAGSMVSSGSSSARNNTPKQPTRSNSTSSLGGKAGSAVGAVLDTKNKVKDKATAVKENIKDMPTQTAYAVHSAKEKAKSSVSDFKRGVVQEQESRQSGRLEKQQLHRQNMYRMVISPQK